MHRKSYVSSLALPYVSNLCRIVHTIPLRVIAQVVHFYFGRRRLVEIPSQYQNMLIVLLSKIARRATSVPDDTFLNEGDDVHVGEIDKVLRSLYHPALSSADPILIHGNTNASCTTSKQLGTPALLDDTRRGGLDVCRCPCSSVSKLVEISPPPPNKEGSTSCYWLLMLWLQFYTQNSDWPFSETNQMHHE